MTARRAIALVVLALPAHALGEDLRGDVLVWQDAKFLVEPGDAAGAVTLATFADGRAGHFGAVIAMKVVAKNGDLVEVEPETTRGCVDATIEVASVARPHLFVARADLAPVLAKPFRASFADGSRVDLKPGIAVRAADTGYLAKLQLRELQLDIPAASIARSYPPSAPHHEATPKPGATLYDTEAGTTVMLAGKPWGGDTLQLESTRATTKGDRVAIELADRCATVVAVAPRDHVKTQTVPKSSPTGVGVGYGHAPHFDWIAKGTALQTASGRHFGTAADELDVTMTPDGKLGCTDVRVELDTSLPGPSRAKIQVCAAASAVKHDGPKPGVKLESPPKY